MESDLVIKPPYGCGLCGIAQRCHGRQYGAPFGAHSWQQPEEQQIRARMLIRRADRLAAEPTRCHAITAWAADHTGESGEPYCADCKTDNCRQWIRIQDRLETRRMELAGINPKARRPSDGSDGWGGEPPW